MTDIPLVTIGGTPGKPLLHLAPANGFVLEIYQPLLRPFFDDFHVVSLPPRALWQEMPPPLDSKTDWRDEAHLFLEGIAQHHLPPMVAIGHSFGGIMALIAALEHPERFQAVIVLDPTILVREAVNYLAEMQHRGRALENPLAQGALRRRRIFASVDEAFANLRSKSVFAQWSDETLRLYAEYGTRPTETGERTLTWSPEWEAYYFSTLYTDMWSMVARLGDLQMPALFLRGGASDTYTEASANEVAQSAPQATHKEIEGHGHLFPLSAPELTAQQIRAWMTQNGLI